MTIKIHTSAKYWAAVAVFYLLLFQNPLESIVGILRYIDELFALAGFAIVFCRSFNNGKMIITRANRNLIVPLLVFMVTGILGNLVYQYQPMNAVLTDIFTNLKFFLGILTGYHLLNNIDKWHGQKGIVFHSKIMAVCIFLLLLLDQFFGIFPSPGYRYGIRITKLFFFHPTYLAGAMVFLLSVLMLFYKKSNMPYIVMCLCVLFFTLRGKAIAGVAGYCLIFYFLIIYRSRLKFWHFIVMALVAFLIAGEQFSYYYLEHTETSARSALTLTAFEIVKDYFPIGTGFGTYGSAQAAEYYSPVYMEYGLYDVQGLGVGNTSFASDTFWPTILGQTGFVGTICFVVTIVRVFLRMLKVRENSILAYATGIFIFLYLMISSTSEAAFHNSIAMPLAMLLGYILSLESRIKKEKTYE